jgi:hypothetical protein
MFGLKLWQSKWWCRGRQSCAGFHAAQALKMPKMKVSAETLAKQVMVSRKAGSRDAAGLLCALAEPPRRLEIRRMRYRSGRDPEASGGKRRPSGLF